MLLIDLLIVAQLANPTADSRIRQQTRESDGRLANPSSDSRIRQQTRESVVRLASLPSDSANCDIVVGSPRDGKGSVFQYDFGKTIQDQSFRQTRFLNQPPTVLRTAVNGLRAQYEDSGHRIEETISNILEKKQRLRQKYRRPDSSSDRLYQASFTHPSNTEAGCSATCGDDPSNLILRRDRTEMEDNPAIHYGTIASANQLIKDAKKRDTLAKEMDILCFEMEAAGLMNHFPFLVIRGICDYSDSHKNKEWQGYAAMAAAAYAKDLLCRILPTRVEAEKKISDILSSVEKDIGEMRVTTQETTDAVKNLQSEQRREKIECWLSPSDPSMNYNNALQKRHEGSGLWFLESDAFAKWKMRRNSFLWLNGIPGCGKTILSSAIIKDLNNTLSSQPLLYFYFDFNDSAKQTLESMLRSLIAQLPYKFEENWKQLDSFFSSHDGGRRQPTRESLCKIFLNMIEQVKEVWIVLDALDECRTRMGSLTEGLLPWIKDLLESEQRNVHLLVTSRPEQDIKSQVSELAHDDDIVPLQSGLIAGDIRAYVHTRVRRGNGLKRWRSQPEVQDEIETRLMKRADGM
ncbi:hypothetical protein GP486_002866 [Trichoglossum hirsutum]|uniref:Nephrocystin 3-like N-terminal domain-containing protein n=1 Tax=Trichoglossum hirsutum TaxID=265104 RepID=A0A9P8RRQ3_9PEZI|nr:hypothetical protein GP486_002866 [Trichoglossum hirsutum]